LSAIGAQIVCSALTDEYPGIDAIEPREHDFRVNAA
jgi:hypothetical protein